MSDLHCRLSTAPTESSLEVGATRKPWIYHPVEALLNLIEKKKIQTDALLIPGDLTNRASREGLSQGWEFALEVGRKLSATAVIPVLGNHDVDSRRTVPDQDAFYNARNLRPGFPFPDEGSSSAYFGDGFYIQNVSSTAQIIAINTVIDHADEQSAKRGRFDVSRIHQLSEFLQLSENRPIRIALMHHHPILHTGTFRADLDVLATGDKLLETLRNSGCGLVVHGHKHLARLATVDGVVILASGSFAATLGIHASSMANMFHVVRVEKIDGRLRGRIETWVFHYGAGWGHASSEHSGFPFNTGFGSTQSVQQIASTLRQLASSSVDVDRFSFEQLKGIAPELLYLTPVEPRFKILYFDKEAVCVCIAIFDYQIQGTNRKQVCLQYCE